MGKAASPMDRVNATNLEANSIKTATELEGAHFERGGDNPSFAYIRPDSVRP
jgi:hypothetical protein